MSIILEVNIFMEKYSRFQKNYMYADIIISNFLVNDFILYKYKHPKVKSNYKLASLFLKKSHFDIEKEIVFSSKHRITCDELVETADKWLEETIKIAHFNWLD